MAEAEGAGAGAAAGGGEGAPYEVALSYDICDEEEDHDTRDQRAERHRRR